MTMLDVNRSKKPTGITVLAVLSILGGIGSLLFGLFIVMVISFGVPLTLDLTFSIVSFIVMGIWGIVVGVAFFIGKKRGWILGVVSFVLGSIVSAGTLVMKYPSGYEYNLAFMGITGLIVYYLYRPHVRAYFNPVLYDRPINQQDPKQGNEII